MAFITTCYRLLDALVTAAGVVLGLTPDPTLAPVESDNRAISDRARISS